MSGSAKLDSYSEDASVNLETFSPPFAQPGAVSLLTRASEIAVLVDLLEYFEQSFLLGIRVEFSSSGCCSGHCLNTPSANGRMMDSDYNASASKVFWIHLKAAYGL